MTQSYTVKDFYKNYIDNIADNHLYKIPYDIYRKIITAYFRYLSNEIIENGRNVKLPCRLGYVEIIKHKPKEWSGKSLRIDYNRSKELDKVVYHLNAHSNGFKYRFYWSKQDAIVINKSKYQLVMTRANKRRLAQIIKNRERDYIEK